MNYFNVGKIVIRRAPQGRFESCLLRIFAEERFKRRAELALFDEKKISLSKH